MGAGVTALDSEVIAGSATAQDISPRPDTAATTTQPRLTHQPALDGLRGLAVAAVVLFHLDRLQGGFLGVDLFFVLSGFLITSLLVVEHRDRGRIDLLRFWARRARRLLPALFLLVAGVALLLLWFTPTADRPLFRGDALATLGYVANWHRMLSQLSYWEQFAQKSPFDHTWSLAIEEQFYLVWPLVAVLVLGRVGVAGRRRQVLGVVALAGAAVSFVLLAVTYSPVDTNRAYFSTDTRLGPTLLGAALALFTAGITANRGAGGRTDEPRRSRWSLVVRWAGRQRWLGWVRGRGWLPLQILGVVAAGWLVWSVSVMDGTSAWYYHGGQALFATAALVVIRIVTATGGGGPLGGLASFPPLRWLGTISYGVYLWHWPLIVYMTPERMGLESHPVWLDIARVVATLVVATASYVFVEQPIRRGALRGWSIRLATAGAVAATLLVAAGATWGKVPNEHDWRGLSFGPVPVEGSDDPYLLYPTPAELGPDTTRVLLVGDSGALVAGPFLDAEAQRRGNVAVASSAPMWCTPVDPEGVALFPGGEIVNTGGECQTERREILRDLVAQFDPDVVLYYLANAGVEGRVRVEDEWVIDCDPLYDDYIAETLIDDAELLAAGGAQIVLNTTPHNYIVSARADEQVECRNTTYEEIVDARPATELIDLDTFVWDHESPDLSMFRDVVHLSDAGAELVAAWWLDEITRLFPDEAGS